MNYLTGFIDVRYHIFYPNQVPAHDKNARKIIEDRGWNRDYSNDPITNISPSDFLVFRKAFAQIGCSGQRNILVSEEFYKSDTKNSKILKALYKTLSLDEINSIANYKICVLKVPKF